ncbi:hypothetical protein CIHG_01809 [Coccidioides immitis H538.4]|uniref:Uncharacterized protein n=3 Tax=Coccidioides immitis TaxID=5501 RepID=A0A0J8R7A9_COCIT|nr:hypothetical protein CIRG_06130 [Coccidioides immitis RMSCC 2394]KMU80340.1 hypothetical protein CISG_02191 [Coccidioides immitis RMSCC 3703]KMU84025.1 hypothetical protein CIHG_01809 [Coccidioides immitis H538.4]
MSFVQRVFATIRAAIVPPNKRGTAGLAIFVLEYQSLDLSPPPGICYTGPTVRIPTHAAACHEKRAIVCGLNIAHPPAEAGGWVAQCTEKRTCGESRGYAVVHNGIGAHGLV